VSVKEEEVHILTKLGFTQTQIKLYLTLLRMGNANGRTLAEQAKVPRSIVYRALDELQKKGLVEKEISQPYTFSATPIQNGLQMLIDQKYEECKKIRKETEKFLRKTKSSQDTSFGDQEFKLLMIDRKERIIQRMRQQHDNAKLKVDILSTPQRWLQILHDCVLNYEKTLSRGVQYRVVLDSCKLDIDHQKNIQVLLSKPNFHLRLRCPLGVNAAIFDGKEASFCFYPSRPLTESPIVWTNHPSFLAMFQSYFENIWESAHSATGITKDTI
jgi:HTH-type transcriptional regulator, sugar sensing transcriptional regulator